MVQIAAGNKTQEKTFHSNIHSFIQTFALQGFESLLPKFRVMIMIVLIISNGRLQRLQS